MKEKRLLSIIKKILKRGERGLNYLYSLYRFRRGLPVNTDIEIRQFKRLLAAFDRDKKIRIFEWGSGNSTLYYSKYLRSIGNDFEWHAIDNSRVWYEKVQVKVKQKALSDKVHLYLMEFIPFWQKPGWDWENPNPCGFGPKSENEKKYIAFPKTLGIKFDLIIIDARFRRRCLIEAREALAPGGLVILHDAQKEHYHSPLEKYKFGRFYESGYLYCYEARSRNKIWIGSNDNESCCGYSSPHGID